MAATQARQSWCVSFSILLHLLCLVFLCSAVEQPDIVFSREQIRGGQLSKDESPAAAPEDCGSSDIWDTESEVGSGQTEDAGSNPSSPAELIFRLKEKPEPLQLAPNAGDAIVPLTEGLTHGKTFIPT